MLDRMPDRDKIELRSAQPTVTIDRDADPLETVPGVGDDWPGALDLAVDDHPPALIPQKKPDLLGCGLETAVVRRYAVSAENAYCPHAARLSGPTRELTSSTTCAS